MYLGAWNQMWHSEESIEMAGEKPLGLLGCANPCLRGQVAQYLGWWVAVLVSRPSSPYAQCWAVCSLWGLMEGLGTCCDLTILMAGWGQALPSGSVWQGSWDHRLHVLGHLGCVWGEEQVSSDPVMDCAGPSDVLSVEDPQSAKWC